MPHSPRNSLRETFAPSLRSDLSSALLFSLILASSSHAQQASLSGITADGAGWSGDGESRRSEISDDGRFVAFESVASNLGPADVNDAPDIYLHDRQTGQFLLLSLGSNNAAVGASEPAISGSGMIAAFSSRSSEIVPGDNNSCFDVFVHDRTAGLPGTISRVSVSTAGAEGNGDSISPSLSADGSLVAFASRATNLVTGDGNGSWDVFIHDRISGVTERVSLDDNGKEFDPGVGCSEPSLSGTGNEVAFSCASQGERVLVPTGNGGFSQVQLTSSATFSEVFVRDRSLGRTYWASPHNLSDPQSYTGASAPSISADGTRVAYTTDCRSIGITGQSITKSFQFDVVLFDLLATAPQTYVRLAQPAVPGFPGDSFDPDISADGSTVVYWTQRQGVANSGDGNLLDDVYQWRDGALTTNLVSVHNTPSGAVYSDSDSRMPVVTGDGREVVFHTWATASTLSPNDPDANGSDLLRWSEPRTYCTGSIASNGCEPVMTMSGVSSASESHGFYAIGSYFPMSGSGAVNGQLLYSVSAPTLPFPPFFSGVKCVGTPHQRGPLVAGLLPTGICSATSGPIQYTELTLDLNAFAAGLAGGSPNPLLSVPGTTVWCQWAAREPSNPSTYALSNGLEYVVGF